MHHRRHGRRAPHRATRCGRGTRRPRSAHPALPMPPWSSPPGCRLLLRPPPPPRTPRPWPHRRTPRLQRRPRRKSPRRPSCCLARSGRVCGRGVDLLLSTVFGFWGSRARRAAHHLFQCLTWLLCPNMDTAQHGGGWSRRTRKEGPSTGRPAAGGAVPLFFFAVWLKPAEASQAPHTLYPATPPAAALDTTPAASTHTYTSVTHLAAALGGRGPVAGRKDTKTA